MTKWTHLAVQSFVARVEIMIDEQVVVDFPKI